MTKITNPYITGALCEIKPTKEDIVTYDVRDVVIKTGDSKHDFVVEKEVYECERKNRDAFIQSFSQDVGIENIIKKIQISGDNSLKLQCKPLYGDFRNLPENNQEFDEAMAKGKEAAKSLGIEMSEEAIKAYIDKVIAGKKAKEAEGGQE